MERPSTREARRDAGFSLAELMVALVVTLVISGAVYGLIASGGNAFRREPELTDRQQNIRIAMSLIQNDVRAAGGGSIPPLFVVFATGLDALGPTAPSGAKSDFLEFWSHDGQCRDMVVASVNGSNLNTAGSIPGCYPEPGMILVLSGGSAKWGYAFNAHSNDNDKFNFPPGQQPSDSQIQSVGDLNNPAPTAIATVQRIRYEIANDTDGTPALWRSSLGGRDVNGVYRAAPAAAGGWLLVARGIEDLQVRYLTAAGWFDQPPAAIATYDNVVRQVRVTLGSRALANKLPGATQSAIGAAVRGQLTTVTSPRGALMALTQASPSPAWR